MSNSWLMLLAILIFGFSFEASCRYSRDFPLQQYLPLVQMAASTVPMSYSVSLNPGPAIIHYSPDPKDCATIKKEQVGILFSLIDMAVLRYYSFTSVTLVVSACRFLENSHGVYATSTILGWDDGCDAYMGEG